MKLSKVAGCDCGKDSLYVCVLSEVPDNLKAYSRKYKPTKLKADKEGVEQLLKIEADIYVIEPTGSYSYIWIETLQKNNRDVRLVSPIRVRNYCKYQGILNKADRPDAAAIAAYSVENQAKPSAFLSLERFIIRELYLSFRSTVRSRNPLQNRLGQRLCYECPELVKSYENLKRTWLNDPPALLRVISGEEVGGPHSIRRKAMMENTIGRGLSQHSRNIAQLLCEFHKVEKEIEEELDGLIYSEDFCTYNKVFDRFKLPQKTRAAILSAIYPFESFLGQDKKPIREYVHGENSKRKDKLTKRDRSEASFKLSLGMGKILFQSGTKTEWRSGGAQYARTAIWLYVKAIIVIHRKKRNGAEQEKQILQLVESLGDSNKSHWLNDELVTAVATITETTPQVASLRLHYEYIANKKGDLRISATAGRFCRTLYKELVKEISAK